MTLNNDADIRLERLRQRRRSYPFSRLAGAALRDFIYLFREARLPLIGFVILVVLGTTYLLVRYDDPAICANPRSPCTTILPAIYSILQLLIFQSSLPFPADLLGEAIFFIFPFLGLALIFQGVLDFGRLLLDKSNRREAWQVSLASTFRDHVLVCGLGRIGYRVVLQLIEAGQEVVVIERFWNSDFVAIVVGLKVPVVLGDARDPEVLRQAGIAHARGLIAVTNDDLLNIEIALAARRRRAELGVVMRIFNQELDVNLERGFGHNSAFSSSALAAPTLAAAALSHSIVHVLPLADGFLVIAEIIISRESRLLGLAQQIEAEYDLRIVHHIGRDGDDKGRANTFLRKLEIGDEVLVLASIETLKRLHQANKSMRNGAERTPIHSATPLILVCGLGKIGLRVVQVLLQSEQRPRVVILCTQHTSARFLDEMRDRGVQVFIGDARDSDDLQAAGIAQASAVIAAVGNDLMNLQIGLTVQALRPDVQLILRVFSDALATRLDTLFSIRTTFSASALAAPTLATATMLRGISQAIDIDDRLLASVTLTTQQGDELCGRTLRHLHQTAELIVVALRRKGQRLIPLPATTSIEPGDELVLLADVTHLNRRRTALTDDAVTLVRRVAGSAAYSS